MAIIILFEQNTDGVGTKTNKKKPFNIGWSGIIYAPEMETTKFLSNLTATRANDKPKKGEKKNVEKVNEARVDLSSKHSAMWLQNCLLPSTFIVHAANQRRLQSNVLFSHYVLFLSLHILVVYFSRLQNFSYSIYPSIHNTLFTYTMHAWAAKSSGWICECICIYNYIQA